MKKVTSLLLSVLCPPRNVGIYGITSAQKLVKDWSDKRGLARHDRDMIWTTVRVSSGHLGNARFGIGRAVLYLKAKKLLSTLSLQTFTGDLWAVSKGLTFRAYQGNSPSWCAPKDWNGDLALETYQTPFSGWDEAVSA